MDAGGSASRLAVTLAVLGALAGWPAADAASAQAGGTITKLAVDGTPVAGEPFTFALDAALNEPEAGSYAFVGLDTAAAGCPAEPADAIFSDQQESQNAFPLDEPGPTLGRGNFVLCAWLTNHDNAAEVYDFKSAPFTVAEGGTLALAFSPAPADGTPVTMTVSGTSDTSGRAAVAYLPAGPGSSCSATPLAEVGNLVPVAFGGPAGTGTIAPGPYSVFAAGLAIPAGAYLFCDWLLGPGEIVVAGGSQIVKVGPFQGSISLPAPFTITSSAQASVAVRFHVNAPRLLWMTLENGGARCAVSPATRTFSQTDPIENGSLRIGLEDMPVPGAPGTLAAGLLADGTAPVDVRLAVENLFTGRLIPGVYRVCAWLTGDQNGEHPDFGPATTTLTIPGSRRGSASGGAAPQITSYRWRIDAQRVLRIAVHLDRRARIILTLYRVSGRQRQRLARLSVRGHRGLNRLVISRWRHLLRRGRYTISLQAERDGHRSRAWSFTFGL